MLKKFFKALLAWCLAFVVAFSCVNLACYFYRSGAGSISRENAYSISIRTPNSRIVRGAEGYGINYIDEKGYPNTNNLPLSNNYILLMGSSHAEGLQVMQKDNMATVLNNMIDPNVRTVYNLGTAGYTLPLIVQGFQAAIEEFPNASAIMIEVSELYFTNDDFKKAMNQAKYDPASSGEALVQSQSTKTRIRNWMLSTLPVISLLRERFESINVSWDGAFGIDQFVSAPTANETKNDNANVALDTATDEQSKITAEGSDTSGSGSFFEALNQTLALLRTEYHKPIILLYHPRVAIQPDGTMSIEREMSNYNDYLVACEKNDIVFVDTGDAFLKAYETDYTVPYGFSNTTIGNGHLNQAGHRIVAEEFYKAWIKIQDEEKN